jgi:diguanylate cyclase (GGDEF)-like protein
VLYKLVLPKHRNLVIPAGNVYIFIMVEFLLVIKQICGRNISWTLLLCSLIATSMVIIIPSYYIIVILLTLGPDMVEYMIVNKDRMNVLYNLVDDVIIAAFCIGINYIFSKIKYEEIKSKDTLYRKSSRDALTGLYNRSYFESYFDKYASWRKKCVIMTLNLDNFKMANDVYGHKKGDEVLCRVAEILKANFCDGDCVARLDGDEFAIFLPEVFKSEVVMERIEHVLKQFPIVIEGETDVEVSVSMGVVFKRAGEVPSYAKLCERADAAMFKAKKTGKAQAYVAS